MPQTRVVSPEWMDPPLQQRNDLRRAHRTEGRFSFLLSDPIARAAEWLKSAAEHFTGPAHPLIAPLQREAGASTGEIERIVGAGATSPEDVLALLEAFPGCLDSTNSLDPVRAWAVRKAHPEFVRFSQQFRPREVSVGAARPRRFAGAAPDGEGASVMDDPSGVDVARPPPLLVTTPPKLLELQRPVRKIRIRNQGKRQTCVAHALATAREIHLWPRKRLSPQFLYWATKTGPDRRNRHIDGTTIECGIDALARLGICTERLWPYFPAVNPGNPAHSSAGHPTPRALASAGRYRWSPRNYVCAELPPPRKGFNRDLVLTALQLGPVVISVEMFRADPQGADPRATPWTTKAGWAFGKVFTPFKNAHPMGMGHAVCVFGFVPDPREPLGGWFLFVNSWGRRWANQAGREISVAKAQYSPSPGCGQIAASYVDGYLWEMALL
ncbi:MAG: hypothetical protein ACYC8T_25710 [Myxococcaceae bacterium]